MKNPLLIFTIFCTQILISQTLIINSGNTLDAEEPIHIVFQLDSIIQNNTFPNEQLNSESLSITFTKVETGKYVFEDGNYRHETIEYEFDDLTIELSHEPDSFIYSFNSDQNFLEFFNILTNETLKNIKFNISFPNPNFSDNEYYETNSEQYIGITSLGGEFNVFFKEGFDESDYSNVLSISNNVISSNFTSLIETANADIILEINEDCGTPHCGRWIGNANKTLQFPIIKDFTGDGINDIVGRIYTHYLGDIDWVLTEEEKDMYFSRWVLLKGESPNEYEAEYSFVSSFDQISEQIKLYSKDLDNDGDLDIYTLPDVYHGLESNKPNNWDGDTSIYINDGIGNFTLFDDIIFPRQSILGQIDDDSDIESISVVGKYDSKYLSLGEDSCVIKILDKIDGEYSEIVSSEIFIQPQAGNKIYTRTVYDVETYDYNNDGIDDIILWLNQKEMFEEFFDNDGNFIGQIESTSIDENGLNSTNYFIIIEGVENGFDFTNSDFSNDILYSYSSLSHLESYSFDILQNGNTNVFFFMELSPTIYDNWNGYEYDGPLSKLFALEINGESLVDITSSYFPNQENENYIFPANEPRFKDFNNDGLLDIYFWGGWATTVNEKESLFLINKTNHFEKVIVPYATFYEDPLFEDFNNDGYIDLYQPLDNYLKFATNIGVFYDENGKKTINYEDNTREILNLTFNDIDRDGVKDSEDQCPDTLTELNVNSIGCSLSQIDTDGDGVSDDADTCSDTISGETVNSTGCSTSQIDTDGDGVNDDVDNCPIVYNPNQEDINENGIGDYCDDNFPDPRVVNINLTEIPSENSFSDLVNPYLINNDYYTMFNQGYDIIDFDNDGKLDFVTMFHESERYINKAAIGVFSFNIDNNKLTIDLNHVIEINGEPNANAPEVKFLNNDDNLDVFIPTGGYHGENGTQPDFYNNTSNRPDFLYYKIDNGFRIDSLDYTNGGELYGNTSVQKTIQVDDDKNYEISVLSYNDSRGTMAIYNYSDQSGRHELVNEIFTSESNGSSQKFNDIHNLYYNDDDLEDLLTLHVEKNGSVSNYKVNVFYGKQSNQVQIDFDSKELIGEFSEDGSIWAIAENEEFTSILKLDGRYILFIQYVKSDGTAKLIAYDLSSPNTNNITNYLFGKEFLTTTLHGNGHYWLDVDNDEDLDLIIETHDGYAAGGKNIIYIQESGRFHPVKFNIEDFGFRGPYIFIDLNQDGKYDIIEISSGKFYLTNSFDDQLSVDDEKLDNSLKLYPNPVTNILTIESKNVAISKVEIYSILGKKIKEINSNFVSITTDKLPKGIYIIRIYSEKGMVMKKTIKM